MTGVEILGWVASLTVGLSIMQKDIKRLRIINLVGCFFFAWYGVLIVSYPLVMLNVFIAIVNIYYLTKGKATLTIDEQYGNEHSLKE